MGSNVWFTSSPSVAFLDSIGGSTNNGVIHENGTRGPSGDFYNFNWINAQSLCDTYNHRQILGLSNWRLPTQGELNNLFTQHGNMFTSREWPTSTRYWSSTTDGDYISNIDLSLGYSNLNLQDSQYYASCISKP